jgi:hypothetical protein
MTPAEIAVVLTLAAAAGGFLAVVIMLALWSQR